MTKSNYDEFGICTDPIKVLAVEEEIYVRYAKAEIVMKQLQDLIEKYGDSDLDLSDDGIPYLVFRAYRMETPEETKIRYNEHRARVLEDRARVLEDSRRKYEQLKKMFEGRE